MDLHAPGGLPPGATFGGRYRVLRCVSAGGMGAIYEVLHLDTRRRRALKVMLPGLADDPDVRVRFEREATIASAVRSEHVVEVMDAGVDGDTGMPFLTMELLDGVDLGQLLRERGRLSGQEVVALLSQAALGLDKVHAAGIVHRDLKPHNLFLARRDDGAPLVKVLDFGIARLAAQADKSTGVLGSPLYMPREQVQGEGTIGPPADVYALAHVAFTLLVGSAYWSREKRRADNTFALLLQSTKGLPEAATARAAAEGVTLPPAFDAWFARATAIDPSARHTSAGELIADLAGALGEVPTDVVPDSLHPPARPRGDGRPPYGRIARAAAVGGGILLVAGAAWEARVALRPAPAPRSCEEIRRAQPDAPDGDYEIHAGEGAGAPVRVYCHDMAKGPREYLTLPRSRATGAGDANCSHYGAGGNTSPGGLTTCFTRVRFLPSALAVDVSDTTFAVKGGGTVSFGANQQNTTPYATAGDCVRDLSRTGSANIDLTGTPFAVEPGQFVVSGWHAAGAAKLHAFNQVADLSGGGHCGDFGTAARPEGAPEGPGHQPLKLSWARRLYVAGRAGGPLMQSAPFGPDRFDRWTSTGTPPPRVLAAHEGELYAVLRKSGPASADGGALVRHGAFGPRMDEAWARLGDGDGIEAMASLDGALYVLARGALATLDLATLARTPAGDAPGATALASWRGALYAVAHDELLRCERGDPARPKACTRWVHAGDARGVMALASHEGRLYAAAGEQILARDDGGAWAVAGRVAGIGDIVAMASSNP